MLWAVALIGTMGPMGASCRHAVVLPGEPTGRSCHAGIARLTPGASVNVVTYLAPEFGWLSGAT
jgi:hypothetical protein